MNADSNRRPLFGGLEAGGTKFVCVVGSGPDDVVAEERFPTTTPQETLSKATDFFGQHAPLRRVGVGSFGPIDLHKESPTWGHITTTPKEDWSNVDLAGLLSRKLQVPVSFDTDVNAAALGEYSWGAAVRLTDFIYLTIGTGIGGGGMVGGKLMHGLVHPEMGHLPMVRGWDDDSFAGVCPYHGDCFEGLASGPALQARWGVEADRLGEDHAAWAIQGRYIAQALVSYIYTLSPQRIILGGGVMNQEQLFPVIRKAALELLNGYVRHDEILDNIDQYIVPPGLGNRAGALGALALAQAGDSRSA